MAHGIAGRALGRAPAVGRHGAPAWVSADGQHAGWGRRRVAADVSPARLAARDAVRVLRAFRAGTRCRAEVSRRARDSAAAHQIAEAPDLVGVPFGEPQVLVRSRRDARYLGAGGRDWILGDA